MLRILLLSVFFLVLSTSAQAQFAREVPVSQQQLQLSYAPIVKKTAPAVVNIYTRKVVQQRVYSPFLNDPFFQHFFGSGLPQGLNRKRLENSLGSGVIVKPDGVIVTSNHVIAGADEITVVLSDRREFEASVVSTDSKSDLAVLRIKAKGETFPFLELKDSDEVEVGDLVIAIGNPFGVGQTVTSGIVSAIARTNLDINDINYYIQTDAAINPGNSGGALVGMDGRLIGINAAIYSKSGGNMGLGFAVPSNMVRSTLASVTGDNKAVVRPWTGISGQPVTTEIASSLGLVRPTGLLVNNVHAASPFAKAGLKAGDVIVSVGGKAIEDPAAFAYRIATSSVGADIDVGFVRASKNHIVRVKLIAPPESTPRDETQIKGKSPLSGAKIANLSPAVAEEYDLRDVEEGVVVVAVDPRSPAAEIGFGKGDVILGINGEAVASVKDVQMALERGGRGWRLSLLRDGNQIDLMIR